MTQTQTDEQLAFRKALGNYPTGVTVVTTFTEANEPIGMTVNSFASVSLDPLLILWSIDKKSKAYDIYTKAEKFAVNILASDQGDICNLFSSKEQDRFAKIEWSTSKQTLPIIANTLSVLECETAQQIDGGDHTIFIGRVVNIENSDKNPLLYHRRSIGEIPASFYE